MAEKLGATPAQVLVAWGVKRGYSMIPKSVQESESHNATRLLDLLTRILSYAGRIISNFKQVKLSDEDYEKVTAVGKGNYARYVHYIP